MIDRYINSLLLIQAGQTGSSSLTAPLGLSSKKLTLEYWKDKQRVALVYGIFYSVAICSGLPVKIIILHTSPFTTKRESEYIIPPLFTIYPDYPVPQLYNLFFKTFIPLLLWVHVLSPYSTVCGKYHLRPKFKKNKITGCGDFDGCIVTVCGL